MSLPETHLQMLSTVTAEGELRMALSEQPVPVPGKDEILVRVEASPINPSDQGVMFGWATMSEASSSGEGTDTVLSAPISARGMAVMKARIGQALPVGNEGAGTVVGAGEGDYAQSLMGKTVALLGGALYAQ